MATEDQTVMGTQPDHASTAMGDDTITATQPDRESIAAVDELIAAAQPDPESMAADDELDTAAQPDPGAIKEAIKKATDELFKRCKSANIPFTQDNDSNPPIIISMPCGREKRQLPIYNLEGIQSLLAHDFEQFTFLDGFAAICNYSTGLIEAGIKSLSPGSIRFQMAKLAARPFSDTQHHVIQTNSPEAGIKITLGPQSAACRALLGDQSPVVIRIEGLAVSQHDQALSMLKRLAGAVFFQIDRSHRVALGLLSLRGGLGRGGRFLRRSALSLEFPRTEYDEAPLALYWYACSAFQMPLLQYLAYYQTIEFYYPAYSQAEAQRRIRSAIKDPTFRVDRDADIAKILGAIRIVGGGFGDERSQLRATMHECVDPEQLRAFITEDEERKKSLGGQLKGVTDKKIPVERSDADLRQDAADRIYDIRCRIVHTKGGRDDVDTPLLLPFSRQADELIHDIQLIRFIAQSVLITASSPLKLHP